MTEGIFCLRKFENQLKSVTETYGFKGGCYLLIDRKSYSVSSAFASTFQCYTMGYLIGEPTGGTKLFRANSFSKVLSKSRFRVKMSTTKLFTPCFYEEDEPVLPNIEMIPTTLEKVHDLNLQSDISKKTQFLWKIFIVNKLYLAN